VKKHQSTESNITKFYMKSIEQSTRGNQLLTTHTLCSSMAENALIIITNRYCHQIRIKG